MRTLLILAALSIAASSAHGQCCKDEEYTLHQRVQLRDSVFADTAALRLNREITRIIRELYQLHAQRMQLEGRPNLYVIRT